MCYVLDRVEAKGWAEGWAEGRILSTYETRLEDIRALMKTLRLTAQQAMDALLIPVAERPKYAEKL